MMMKFRPKIKRVRSLSGRIQVYAYGYKIVYLRSGKHFMIVDSSILCAIKFETLKAAVLTCKMNQDTFVRGHFTFDGVLKKYVRPKLVRITV